ncbi:MAG: DnaJ domain-containing protein, partial [Alphaproteobacteria bacterium]|nr:DnaJ domain-containing protein [Alphaproteobacteria bacterium]
RCLKVLDLDESASLKDVKKRYKQLVKQYHPDALGRNAAQDEAAAERLREIIQAYTHLRTCGLLADSE